MSRSRASIILLGLIAAGAVRCANVLGPGEAGLPVPKDPGTVLVRVRDQTHAPVRDARVFVEMPNAVGSLFKVGASTGTDGTIKLGGIPAGRRRVEVIPPPGFSAGPHGLIRDVDVVKDSSVTADFVLVRNQ